MRRSEFCQSRGLSFSTLDRQLKRRRWNRKTRSAPAKGQLVRDYLAAVLPGLADRTIQRLPKLTPAAWVAQHS
jgi:hypothetical protein